MRLAIVAVATLAAIVQAQSFGDLPQCAQNCVGTSLTSATGCGSLQVKCICESRNWIGQLSCCVAKDCNAADQQTTITFASKICAVQGVTVPTNATEACAAISNSTSSSTPAAGSATKQYIGTGLSLAAAGLFAAML